MTTATRSSGPAPARRRRWATRPARRASSPRVRERGWEQAAATLGVLAAGAAYLPLDPALPRERLRHLLERGRVAVALTQERLRARRGWPTGVELLALDGDGLTGEPQAPPAAAAFPGGLAYVIFTSGSTGEPKGVMIEHRSALNTVLDVNRRFQVGPEDRVLALSALSFDLSVYDLFGPPAAGGAVVLPAAGGERDPAVWAATARRHRVTLWNSVPVLAELLADDLEAHPELAPPPLRLALLSGDWVPVRLPERLRRLSPNLQVVSLGGATEGSIWSILHPVDEVEPVAASIPYGRPMAHQSFQVLDAALAPRPAWVPGELWIGGRGLARGYWRDGGRTALAFLPHPTTGERLYRTGDLGRRRPDGTIEFLGREDYQVKVRGYRVELGEIEAVLGRHPAVREAVVTVVTAAGDPRGERRLAAWVVPAPAGSATDASGLGEAEELRRFLEARLPPYMVPASFHLLEALPLTANGKVDRGALTLPEPGEEPTPTRPQAADSRPVDPLTERIATLVAGVLERARIDPGGLDPEANLLELGATSLEVIRLANHLEAELGSRPSVDQFYREPTLEALVRFYRRQAAPQVPPGPGETAGAAADFEVILDPDERQAFKDRHPGLRPIPDVEGDGDGGALALPEGGAREDLAHLYRERVSHRTFSSEVIPLERFGRLLACLTAEERPGGHLKLLYPSAGALYPVQVYLHVEPGRVDGLAAGTYYHHPVEHRLVRLSRQATLEASIHDPFVNRPIFKASAFSLFLVARLSAIGPIYGANAHFFSALEAGYMGQLLMMHAPSCGLGLCPIGVLDFDRIRHLFDLEPTDVLVHTFLGGPLDPDAPRGEAVPLEEPYPWKVRLEGGREEGEL